MTGHLNLRITYKGVDIENFHEHKEVVDHYNYLDKKYNFKAITGISVHEDIELSVDIFGKDVIPWRRYRLPDELVELIKAIELRERIMLELRVLAVLISQTVDYAQVTERIAEVWEVIENKRWCYYFNSGPETCDRIASAIANFRESIKAKRVSSLEQLRQQCETVIEASLLELANLKINSQGVS